MFSSIYAGVAVPGHCIVYPPQAWFIRMPGSYSLYVPRMANPYFIRGLDNASGVATILEIAQAHMKLPSPTKRSVLFMATTAEEAGLLGAKYYANNPLYPLEKTLADINIDGVSAWGKTRDIEDTSDGNSTLDDMLGEMRRHVTAAS